MTALATRPAEPVTAADTRRETIDLLTGPEASGAWQAYRAGDEPDPRALFALLGRHRLLAPAWPASYGGRGLSPHHQAAVVDGLVELGVAETLHTLSIQIAGTFLLTAGDRAQRATVLPGLAAGRSFCTILYSEPDVGSDLAALSTTAARDGHGGWRLTGRKVYSLKTHVADLALVAARTSVEATRYQGVSLFLVPLGLPGVTIGRLGSIADEHFADVTLDGVRVPGRAVVGPVGGAWPLITEALALERTGVDYHAKARTWLDIWREYHPDPDPEQAARLARLTARTAAAGLFADRCLTQLAGGRVDPTLAALTKLWCADTAREVAWWCTEESGPDAVWRAPAGLIPRPRSAPDSGDPSRRAGLGRLETAYREAPGLTISAGTAEMMLEVIAGSGLPAPGADLIGVDEEPLRRALRAAVRAIATEYDDAEPAAGWWAELARAGAFGLDVPGPSGGLGLGPEAAVVVCEELGRARLDHGLLDTLTAIDALVAGAPQTASRLADALGGRYRAAIWDGGTDHPLLWPDPVDEVLLLTAGQVALVEPPPTEAVASAAAAGLRRPTSAPVPGLTLDADAATLRRGDRLRRAGWLTGLAIGALAETVRRAHDRKQFGRALIEHQSIAFRLARLTSEVTATRLLIDAAAADVRPGPAARALAAASDLALLVTREAMQLAGAWGMTDPAPAQRYYRSAFVATGLIGPAGRRWREAASDTIEGARHG